MLDASAELRTTSRCRLAGSERLSCPDWGLPTEMDLSELKRTLKERSQEQDAISSSSPR